LHHFRTARTLVVERGSFRLNEGLSPGLKGRALQLFDDFKRQAAANGSAFGVCRVILLARVLPERLTYDLDDPELEERLEQAIRAVNER
jgi:hypothetical protein